MKVVKVDKNGRAKISDFKGLVDLRKIKYYSVEEIYTESGYGGLILKFYDKDKKRLPVKGATG
jgi:hypothetical protein